MYFADADYFPDLHVVSNNADVTSKSYQTKLKKESRLPKFIEANIWRHGRTLFLWDIMMDNIKDDGGMLGG